MKTYIPEGYSSSLDLNETQAAIALIKRTFLGHTDLRFELKKSKCAIICGPGNRHER